MRRRNLVPELASALGPAAALAGGTALKGRRRPEGVPADAIVFETLGKWDERFGGAKQGTIEVAYQRLTTTFGEPVCTAENGIDLEWWPEVTWYVAFDDGTVAQIYDWKSTVPPEENIQWNVAGDPAAFDHVVAALGLHPTLVKDQRIAFRDPRAENRARTLARRLKR